MEILLLFKKGGPIMWPILAASVAVLTVLIERLIFTAGDMARRDGKIVEQILMHARMGEIATARQIGNSSRDSVVKVLVSGLEHQDEESVTDALMRGASNELRSYERGLPLLDAVITLAPLLGLLGTVTGMIHAFGILGNQELGSPSAITGGIAEALIATAFGLGVAIAAVVPYTYFNTRFEKRRHEIEDAATHLEILLRKAKKNETCQPLH